MSLFYQIVFPQNAPNPEPLVQQLAIEWGSDTTVSRENKSQLLVLQNEKLLLDVFVSDESNYLELSFGEYHYQTDWYLVLGKTDSEQSRRFYLELVKKLALDFPHDFLSLFNGELVVLKKEGGQLYLNTERGLWDDPDRLSTLNGLAYSLAAYPI